MNTQRNNPVLASGHCTEYEKVNKISRRDFLSGSLRSIATLMLGPAMLSLPAWMPRVAMAAPHVGPRGDTLVCIFLRGGADGLNIIVPHGDDEYYRARPQLNIARPDDRNSDSQAVDLDGFFGLHPALAPLQEIYAAGDLAAIQAVGSPDETRSHFEAMDLMERGATTNGDYTGWLARHLATLDTGNNSALRAVSIDEMLPGSLTGSVSATALQSIGDYHLRGRDDQIGHMQALLTQLYNQHDDMLSFAANQTFAAIDILAAIDTANYVPRGRAYPGQAFGRAMTTVAQLIKAEAGLEIACVDLGGWDTHVAQGAGQGIMAGNLARLGEGLAAFYEDILPYKDRVTVVVMSEFGRRVKENGGLGTDHGHGGMMMVMGGGIQGQQVYADWPGLAEEQRVGPGDLAVTTDYRDVLGEIIRKRLNNPQAAAVFPDYTINEVGLAVPFS